MLTLAHAIEIALIRLDFARQIVAGQLAGDKLAQLHEERDVRVAIHTDKLRLWPSLSSLQRSAQAACLAAFYPADFFSLSLLLA